MESVISSSNDNPGQIQILHDSTHSFNQLSIIGITTHSLFHVTDWSSPYITAGILNKIFGGIAYG